MSRLISYPYDNIVTDGDAWVGSEVSSRQTKQYTAAAVADYLNINGKISIIGQMTYQYGPTPLSGVGTLAIFGGGPDIVAFSAVTKLTLSNQDIGGQRVVEFLNLLVGSDVLIAEQGAISTFGYYSIDSYAINATNTDYYDLGVTFKSGNGSMRSDRIYEAQNFVLANDATQSPWNTVPDGISYTAANVGIGTTSPSEKLEVSGGNLKVSNTGTTTLALNSTNSSGAQILALRNGSTSPPTGSLSWSNISGIILSWYSTTYSQNSLVLDGSNFIVTNNGSERMRIISSGNVGIGTTNPGEKLTVQGNTFSIGNVTAYADSSNSGVLSSTGYLQLRNSGSTNVNIRSNGTSYLNGGNVGIGTTNPGAKLDVLYGGLAAKFVSTQNTGLEVQGGANAQDIARFKNTGGNVQFVINNGGNVGIGVASPSAKLEVVGNILANATNATVNIGSTISTTPSYGYSGTAAGTLIVGGYTNAGYSYQPGVITLINQNPSIGAGTDLGVLQFAGKDDASSGYVSSNIKAFTATGAGTGNNGGGIISISTSTGYGTPVERFRINQSGNVGIGTTSPSQKLDVNGSMIADTYYVGNTSNYIDIATGLRLRSNSDGIRFMPGGADTVKFLANGNVGIGTTAPVSNYKLHIVGTGRPALFDSGNAVSINKFANSTSGNGSFNGLDIVVNSTANTSINSYGMPLTFGTSSTNGVDVTERMRITSAGNVGIGTTSPSEKLEVDGEVLSDGYRLSAMQTAPAARDSAGTLGEIRITSTYIYVCYATDSWSRVALDTSW